MDIVSALTVIASLIIAAVGVMRARAEAASAVTEGFNALCTQLQSRIKALEEELGRVQAALALELAKKNRLEDRCKNLELRIQDLERERLELRAELAALRPSGGY